MSQVTDSVSLDRGAPPVEGTVEDMFHKFHVNRSNGPLAKATPQMQPASVPVEVSPRVLLHTGAEADAVQGGGTEDTPTPDANGPDEVDEANGTGAADAAASEDYALLIPASLEGKIKPEQIEAFTDYAKSAGLSNEQAQAALDFKIHLNREFAEVQKQQVAQWESAVRADSALGGKNINTTVATATRAMQHFDPKGGISKLLSESGHGSNPEVVRFLYNIGKSLGEDKVPFTRTTRRSDIPLEERLYPNFKFA